MKGEIDERGWHLECEVASKVVYAGPLLPRGYRMRVAKTLISRFVARGFESHGMEPNFVHRHYDYRRTGAHRQEAEKPVSMTKYGRFRVVGPHRLAAAIRKDDLRFAPRTPTILRITQVGSASNGFLYRCDQGLPPIYNDFNMITLPFCR